MSPDPARQRHLDDLRRARVAAGLSLRDVAAAIGVSHLTFANYERGVGPLTEAQIEAYHALLRDRGSPTPPGSGPTTGAVPLAKPDPAEGGGATTDDPIVVKQYDIVGRDDRRIARVGSKDLARQWLMSDDEADEIRPVLVEEDRFIVMSAEYARKLPAGARIGWWKAPLDAVVKIAEALEAGRRFPGGIVLWDNDMPDATCAIVDTRPPRHRPAPSPPVPPAERRPCEGWVRHGDARRSLTVNRAVAVSVRFTGGPAPWSYALNGTVEGHRLTDAEAMLAAEDEAYDLLREGLRRLGRCP